MRHLNAGRRLGLTTSHRRAMMRNLVTSILEKGQVRCTLSRAKEVRKPLEKMITLAKRGDLHSRRQALRFVKTKQAMTQLFNEIGKRYGERQGGYCRIIKLGRTRLGDNADMAIVQLIGSEKDQLSSLKKKITKKKPARKKESKVLKEVTEEVLKAEEEKKQVKEQDASPQEANEKSSEDKVEEEVKVHESEEEIQSEVNRDTEDYSEQVDIADTEVEQKNAPADESKQESLDDSEKKKTDKS